MPSQVSDRDSAGYVPPAQVPQIEDEVPPEIANELYHPDEPLDAINVSIDGDSLEVGSCFGGNVRGCLQRNIGDHRSIS